MNHSVSTAIVRLACTSLLVGLYAPRPVRSDVLADSQVTIAVDSAPRQTFGGFGTSHVHWTNERSYGTLTQAERDTLARLVWRDAKMKHLRLWVGEKEIESGDVSTFVRVYQTSGVISDARKNGCKTLLLAPENIPARWGQNGSLAPAHIADYARAIATFLAKLKAQNITINATGILNEPNDRAVRINAEQWPEVVKAFRAALNAQGLRDMAIVAPELANVDDLADKVFDGLQADTQAWQALGAFSTHSYTMAARQSIADRLDKNPKPYYMTEASANGAATATDALAAASTTARVLSDLNHRVTHWFWFVAYTEADPNDDQTRLIRYWTKPFHYEPLAPYFALKQLAHTFDVGCVLRQTRSDKEGGMAYTYGKKPRVTVAVGKNPDGSFAVGVVNYTHPHFTDTEKNAHGQQSQTGYAAQTFRVTVRIPEIATKPVLFHVQRSSNPLLSDKQIGGTLTSQNGTLTLRISPLEIVTLRSVPARR